MHTNDVLAHKAGISDNAESIERGLGNDALNLRLRNAAWEGDHSACRLLIDNGASVLAVNASRQSALHEAAYSGQFHVVGLLIKAGAELDLQDLTGDTPLHKAAASGQSMAAKALIEGGARSDIMNVSGLKPEDVAFKSGYHEVARFILSLRQNEPPKSGQDDAMRPPRSLEFDKTEPG